MELNNSSNLMESNMKGNEGEHINSQGVIGMNQEILPPNDKDVKLIDDEGNCKSTNEEEITCDNEGNQEMLIKKYELRPKKKLMEDHQSNEKEEDMESDPDYNDQNSEEEQEDNDVEMKGTSSTLSDNEMIGIQEEITELTKENIENEKNQYDAFIKELTSIDKERVLENDNE